MEPIDVDDLELCSLPAPKRQRTGHWQLTTSRSVIDLDSGLQEALRARPGESDEAFASRLHQSWQEEVEQEQRRVAHDCALAKQLHQAWIKGSQDVQPQHSLCAGPANLAALVGLPTWATPMAPEVPELSSHCVELGDVRVFGTKREPFLHVRNVDGQFGLLLAGRVLNELRCKGLCLSLPEGRVRNGIVVQKHLHHRTANPWHTGIRVLHDLADSIRCDLARSHACQVPDLRRAHRGWSDTEVMVSGPGFKLKRHTDLQPAGSLLFIFSIGLASNSQAWPGGVLKEVRLESGDLMILDGRRTAHAVPCLVPRSSPFPKCPWLATRRLVVLVRERPPG
ncbi:unnamed protein product [Symbiodinium pilosum]|uniref:Alpha-ketoglutarate-dependent dioxygenase AlkB-like domain-containing protein n=1 Tax=Symbiodinium pilosum TaxID=2952 RepID=A0A812VBG2_SYMPI|nr:unnamed protein product [Symbiodinium pilosum]